eukprot:TRINITY_DN12399_c0_g1_i1.p1 TRINITY_DN12399_c0_g1~~TRINITY_DN12399_c0_g1_i1.p1  ORF type:complete len:348 (-),score=60.35 TRINITY_DN12399_c0_g1_i1:83-1126(-)
MLSHTGRTYRYRLETVPSLDSPDHARREERMHHLLIGLNRVLEKRRDRPRYPAYRLSIPCIVPVSQRLRLVHEGSLHQPLLQTYADWCHKGRRDVHSVFAEYWATYHTALGSTSSHELACEAAFQHLCRVVPDDVLYQHLHVRAKSFDTYFTVRKVLAHQVGLWGLYTHLFRPLSSSQGSRHLSVGVDSGEMMVGDFFQEYSAVALPTSYASMRLTRNIARVLTPIAIEGPLLSSMFTATLALAQQQDYLQNLMRAHFDADVGLFSVFEGDSGGTRATPCKVTTNVKGVLDRLEGLMPTRGSADGMPHNAKKSQPPPPLSDKVEALLRQAKDPKALATEDVVYMTWF